MSASTASSAGRFACMSEMSAYRITRARRASRHITVADAGHALTKFARVAEPARERRRAWSSRTRTREVALGRGREQIECADVPRLRLGDDALDELATEPTSRHSGATAVERSSACSQHISSPTTPTMLPLTLGDDEPAQRLGDATTGSPLAVRSCSTRRDPSSRAGAKRRSIDDVSS